MNKKLLKSIVCIASGVGVATSIPFTVSSCGSSSEDVIPSNALPYGVYEITNGILSGFKPGINLSVYDDGKCDTMLIPDEVTVVENSAFLRKIPPFISKLVFSEKSKLTRINYCAFMESSSLTCVDLSNCNNLKFLASQVFESCSALTSVILPNISSTITITGWLFENCSKLNNIKWNSWKGPEKTDIQGNMFQGVASTGTVTVINPIDETHNSAALLAFLQTKGGLPTTGWTAE